MHNDAFDIPPVASQGGGSGLGKRSEGLLLVALALYAAFVFSWGAGGHDVRSSMETSRAAGAQAMLRTGDYLVPRIGLRPNYAKPPLFYWLAAAVSWPRGDVSEFTLRFASALCGVGAVLIVFVSGRKHFGFFPGLLAGFVLATTPVFIEQAAKGLVNAMLACFTAGTLLSAFEVTETQRKRWLPAVLCGVALAAGMMTKGPVILLFFVPTLLAYSGFVSRGQGGSGGGRGAAWVLSGAALAFLLGTWTVAASNMFPDFPAFRMVAKSAAFALWATGLALLVCFGVWGGARVLRDRRWAVAFGLMVLLSALWPLALVITSDFGNLWAAMLFELWAERTTEVGASNYASVWHYFVAAPLVALPWSLFILITFQKGYAEESEGAEARLLLFSKCWALGSIVVFTVVSSARSTRYLLPLFPGAALLGGHVLARGLRGGLRTKVQRFFDRLAAAVVYAMPAAPVGLVAAWIIYAPERRLWAGAAAGLAALATVGGFVLRRAGQRRLAGVVALAVMFPPAAFTYHAAYCYAKDARSSVRPMCERLAAAAPAEGRLWLYDTAGPQVVFYLRAAPLATNEAHPSWDALQVGDSVAVIADAKEPFLEAAQRRFRVERIAEESHRRDTWLLFMVKEANAP